MSKINNGWSAFPTQETHVLYPHDIHAECREKLKEIKTVSQGMALRDWFAGQVMPKALSTVTRYGESPECMTSQAAKLAYRFADAMLAEREKK